jgi:hypothetical protein
LPGVSNPLYGVLETSVTYRSTGYFVALASRIVSLLLEAEVAGKPKISAETIDLIRKMAVENCLWGAERIRGELLKLGIEVSKRTIQKYMPKARPSHVASQTWATFLKNQAGEIWACDFAVVYDWLFRQWYIFVVMELKTRRIVHMGVTKYPTDEWTVQQLREATPWVERAEVSDPRS